MTGPAQRPAPAPSGRYTPPLPKSVGQSPKWMGYLIVGLVVLGMVVIVLNYVSVLPGGATNWYLLVGLALITAGFLTATRYH